MLSPTALAGLKVLAEKHGDETKAIEAMCAAQAPPPPCPECLDGENVPTDTAYWYCKTCGEEWVEFDDDEDPTQA